MLVALSGVAAAHVSPAPASALAEIETPYPVGFRSERVHDASRAWPGHGRPAKLGRSASTSGIPLPAFTASGELDKAERFRWVARYTERFPAAFLRDDAHALAFLESEPGTNGAPSSLILKTGSD